ncbi:MAG: hypothetical protein HC893_11595 [Chloroflexaceae bacterium]|nr:hypothetical protein [Chloroflexaceae bacterium]
MIAPPALPAGAATPTTWLFVDDDYCSSCANDGYAWNTTAFNTIAAAVTAAGANTQITVYPGVYSGFPITGKTNLSIVGVDADAVFVQGSGTNNIPITNSTGVALANLTISGGTNSINLSTAGVGGYSTPANRIILDHLLLRNFSGSAVTMDRTSTAVLRRSTIVGSNGSGNYINIGTTADALFVPVWSTLANLPATQASSGGGGLVAAGGNAYALLDNDQLRRNWQRFTPGTGWAARADAPIDPTVSATQPVQGDANNIYVMDTSDWSPADTSTVYAIAINGGDVYVGGTFAVAHQGSTLVPAYSIVRRNGGAWFPLGGGLRNGSGLATVKAIAVTGNFVYLGGTFTRGINPDGTSVNSTNIIRWNTSTSQWESQGTTNGSVEALLVVGTRIYMGGAFTSVTDTVGGSALPRNRITYRVVASGGWQAMTNADTPGNFLVPANTIRAIGSNGSHLWVGGDEQRIQRWDISDGKWEKSIPGTFPPDPSIPFAFSTGGQVRDIQVYNGGSPSGSWLYVGGDFTFLNEPDGIRRYDLRSAALGGSGGLDGWSSLYGDVNKITYIGGAVDWMYAAGSFFIDYGDLLNGTPSYQVANHLFPLDPYDGGPFSSGFDRFFSVLSGVSAFSVGAGTIEEFVASGSTLYAGGNFNASGGRDILQLNTSVGSISSIDNLGGGVSQTPPSLFRYNTSTDTWTVLEGPRAQVVGIGGTGGGRVYALATNATANSSDFYEYNTGSNTWTARAALPADAGAGNTMAWDGTNLYTLVGGSSNALYRYNPGSNSWVALAALPTAISTVGAGAALEWDGGSYLYATAGGNGAAFARYNIGSNAWEALDNVPGTLRAGGDLARIGTTLYAVRGEGTNSFYSYPADQHAHNPKNWC